MATTTPQGLGLLAGFSSGVGHRRGSGLTYPPHPVVDSRRRLVDAVRQWLNRVATQYDRAADGIHAGIGQAESARNEGLGHSARAVGQWRSMTDPPQKAG